MRHFTWTSRGLSAAVFRTFLVALLAMAALYAMSVAGALVSRDHYLTVVREAVESDTLQRGVSLPFARDIRTYSHNFNDCLILSMLILPREDEVFRRALSPRVPDADEPWAGVAPPGYPPYVQCRNLARVMDAAPGAEPGGVYYHRYLHGDWVLAEGLLALFPFALATDLLAIVLVGTLATLGGVATRKALSCDRAAGRDLAYAVLAFMLLVFDALPVFARSFSFAPADIVLASFLLYFYRRPPASLRVCPKTFIWNCSIFSASTGWTQA